MTTLASQPLTLVDLLFRHSGASLLARRTDHVLAAVAVRLGDGHTLIAVESKYRRRLRQFASDSPSATARARSSSWTSGVRSDPTHAVKLRLNISVRKSQRAAEACARP